MLGRVSQFEPPLHNFRSRQAEIDDAVGGVGAEEQLLN
jgi:hypothetical protein